MGPLVHPAESPTVYSVAPAPWRRAYSRRRATRRMAAAALDKSEVAPMIGRGDHAALKTMSGFGIGFAAYS